LVSYDIIPTERGFNVIPRKYDYIQPIKAEIDDFGFWKVQTKLDLFGEEHWMNRCDLLPAYAFRKLEDAIVDEIYSGWKSPKSQNGYVHKNVKKWAKVKSTKAGKQWDSEVCSFDEFEEIEGESIEPEWSHDGKML